VVPARKSPSRWLFVLETTESPPSTYKIGNESIKRMTLRTSTEERLRGAPSTRTTRTRAQYLPGVAPNKASGTVKYVMATRANTAHGTVVVHVKLEVAWATPKTLFTIRLRNAKTIVSSNSA
jgi:hypothetical protein